MWTRHQWPDIIFPSSQQVECVSLAHKPVLCCLKRLKQPPKGCRVCQPADFLFSVHCFKSLTFNKLEATLRRFYVYRILTTCKVLWPFCINGWDRCSWVCLQQKFLGVAEGVGLKLNQNSSWFALRLFFFVICWYRWKKKKNQTNHTLKCISELQRNKNPDQKLPVRGRWYMGIVEKCYSPAHTCQQKGWQSNPVTEWCYCSF